MIGLAVSLLMAFAVVCYGGAWVTHTAGEQTRSARLCWWSVGLALGACALLELGTT